MAKKVINVPDELIPANTKQAINVSPTLKEVAIPRNTVYWRSGDTEGFINKSGVAELKKWHEAQGLPFEADETKLTMPKPVGFTMPFGNGGGGCKNC